MNKTVHIGNSHSGKLHAWLFAFGFFAILATTAEAALPDNVIYRNDFTVRESAGAIPRIGETYTATPYPTTSKKLYPYLDSANIDKASLPCRTLYSYYGYLNFLPSYWADVGDSRPSYDGWFQPNFAKGLPGDLTTGADGRDLMYLHTGTVYQETDANGNVNPCFRFYYSPESDAARVGTALKSLHNVFTNGQLKIQVDLKMPLWVTKQAHFWVFPVFDKYMDIEAWQGVSQITNCAPGLFGVRSGDNLHHSYPQYNNTKGNGTQIGNNHNNGSKRIPWIRYVVTYDLDNATFSGRWDALTDWVEMSVVSNATEYAALPHPTFDTEIPNLNKNSSFSNQAWFKSPTVADLPAIWAEKGGISGIGFFLGKINNDTRHGCSIPGGINTVTNNKVQADNIRVSWKAPGADAFEMVYEDDFSNRTYRVLSAPNVGTRATYAAGTETTGLVVDSFTGYAKGNDSGTNDGYDKYRLLTTALKPYATTLQPLCVDGWRRLAPFDVTMNGTPWTRNKYYGDEDSNGTLLEIGGSGHYCCFSQLIGEEMTSGKVKISVDAHVPNCPFPSDFTFIDQARQRIAVALGPTALHSSLTAAIPGNTFAGGGFYLEKTDNATNNVAFTYGTGATLSEDRTVEIGFHTWYRLEVTADLGARTYDMSITPLGSLWVTGDFVPTNDVAMTATGIPFASDAAGGIGAFYLWGYGYGGSTGWSQKTRTAFDNIRIWKIAEDGETAVTNLVYSNDFDTRTRIMSNSVRASGRLAYQYDRDDGPDHWIRRNGSGYGYFEADATVRDDGGNQFLSLGRESGDGHRTFYTTSLGQSVSSGTVTIKADIRPPQYWFGYKNGSVVLSLGNKLMEQNAVKDSAAGRLLRFGFRDSTSSGNGGRYEDMRPFAMGSGDGAATGSSNGPYSYMSDTVDGAAQKWYRFVIKVNLDARTFDAAVYDMGTEHPTPESPRGALVGNMTGLSLMNPLGDGLSSLDVSCYAVTSTFGETGVDPLHVLVDNITVCRPEGCIVVVF